MQVGGLYYKSCDFLLLSKPSAGFTIVLRCSQAQGPVGQGGIFVPYFFYDGFLLMWCNFKFEGVLFRSDSRHSDRVDSLLCVPPSGPK